MSSNNSQTNGASFGIALVAAGLMFFAIGLFVFLAVVTAAFSLLSLFALFRPVKLGKYVIKPKEARWFLLRGIIGWFGFTFLVLTIAPVFNIRIREDWIIYIMMTGYMLGSLGVEWLITKLSDGDEGQVTQSVPAEPAKQIPAQSDIPPKPFHYASWDDEEDTRK